MRDEGEKSRMDNCEMREEMELNIVVGVSAIVRREKSEKVT